MAADLRDVVITGLGAVAPTGVGVEAYAAALRAGRSGVRPLAWSHPRCGASVAAECVDFEAGSVMSAADLARVPRLVPMGLMAAREACAMAGLADFAGAERAGLVEEARRVGLVLGTGGAGLISRWIRRRGCTRIGRSHSGRSRMRRTGTWRGSSRSGLD